MKQIRFRNSKSFIHWSNRNSNPDLSHLEPKVCLCETMNLPSPEVIKEQLSRDAVQGTRVGRRMSRKVHSNP